MFKRINLNGKTALVTGAGKGLGKACAIALAEAGAKVFIISRKNKKVLVHGIRSRTNGAEHELVSFWQGD